METEQLGLPAQTPETASWSVTTTTIWCHEIDQRVCLLVRGDWTAYCVWYRQQQMSGGGIGRCAGQNCRHLQEYRHKLIEEEVKTADSV